MPIDQHSRAPSPGAEIRSSDAVIIRGTSDCDCRIPVNGGAGSTVMNIEAKKAHSSVLKIAKVELTGEAPGREILADGAEITIEDRIVLRDTAGAANLRLNPALAPTTPVDRATRDEATPFGIAEPSARLVGFDVDAPTAATRLGGLNGPECSKLEWRNDGISGTPSPTQKTAPQAWARRAEDNAQALTAARSDLESCPVTGTTPAGLAALVPSGAGACPTFDAAFSTCVAATNVAQDLVQDAVNLKGGTSCTW